MVLVRLKTSNSKLSDIFSRIGKVLRKARIEASRSDRSCSGLLGSHGTRLSPPRPSRVPVKACGRLVVEEKLTDSKFGRPLASVSKPVHSQPLTTYLAKALLLFIELRTGDERADEAVALVQVAVALIVAVGAVVEAHRTAAEEDRVAAGFLVLIQFVRPGVGRCCPGRCR